MKFCIRSFATGSCVFLTYLLAGCGDSDSEATGERAIPEVSVVTVGAETVATERLWLGVMEPLRSVLVQATESGEVVSLKVGDGDFVEKGTALLSLEGTELRARRDVLERRRGLLQESLTRWRELAEAGAAGPSEVETAEREFLEVEEELAALKARMHSAELRAPVAGRVTGLMVATGARVSAGDPILRIRDGDATGLRLEIPARERRYLDDVAAVQAVDASGNRFPVTRVVSVDDSAVPRGYVAVEIWLEADEEIESREVMLTYRSERSAVLAPWTAVALDDDYHWVAVVEGEPAVVKRRRVRLGSGHADGIEVLDGLEPGERILRFEPRSQPDGIEVFARAEGDSA